MDLYNLWGFNGLLYGFKPDCMGFAGNLRGFRCGNNCDTIGIIHYKL